MRAQTTSSAPSSQLCLTSCITLRRLFNLSDSIVHGDFVKNKWEMHIKYKIALIRIIQFPLILSKNKGPGSTSHQQLFHLFPDEVCSRYPRLDSPFKDPNRETLHPYHPMLGYWNFISLGLFIPLLSPSSGLMLWCHNPVSVTREMFPWWWAVMS